MKLHELFGKGRTVFSLEIFPPKRTDGIETLYTTLDRLTAVKPDYISVTYGAGGSAANNLTCRIASDIRSRYGIEPLPHLTCLYNTRGQVDAYLAELSAAGIENILALRGDRVADMEVSGEFAHASDLAAYIGQRGDFNCVGACYPEGHPECPSLDTDIDNLKIKLDAGVTHLNSQLFFNNEDFYAFLDKARARGINVPIEAGIMPVINARQISRMVANCGASMPAKFARIIARYENDPQALMDAGMAYAIDQITDLIASGVDGIHLYTMNRPEVASRVWEAVKNML
ncbi:MAG: methylenetetrahydrofolate reductase [NAD(P)H] [Ruminococcaceae bacterium]|nr:methylenetetrahydrofolate reductase [NAD(P)H] [Oscillospiraceae bacterium]